MVRFEVASKSCRLWVRWFRNLHNGKKKVPLALNFPIHLTMKISIPKTLTLGIPEAEAKRDRKV
jgi:hypothetical protein